MSKKVDIEKLIEKKYSDGKSSASLTLENLMSEISLALEQIAGSGAEQAYGSKLPGDLGESDYINVAKDNPALSMGHGVERGNADGHSEGGTVDKPRIENPLPEAKAGEFANWASEKGKQKPGVRKLVSELFVPVLTTEKLSLRGSNTPDTMSTFFKACQIAGIHSRKTMKEKLEALNSSIYSPNVVGLSQMIASSWLTRSIYNTFLSLDADSYGKINEHIITSFYGVNAVAAGGGSTGEGGISDIIIPGTGGSSDRFIGLKTKVFDQKFKTSFLNLFKHIVLEKKPYEIFWFAKVHADEKYLDFKFDARKIDDTNIEVLLPSAQQSDLRALISFLNKQQDNEYRQNIQDFISGVNSGDLKKTTLALATLINKLGALESLKNLNLKSIDTKLSTIFSNLESHPQEPGYEFTIDVQRYADNSNQNYKNIDTKIVELYNNFTEFVQAYNKFVMPDVPGYGGTQNLLNVEDGRKAQQKANELPSSVSAIIAEVEKVQQSS